MCVSPFSLREKKNKKLHTYTGHNRDKVTLDAPCLGYFISAINPENVEKKKKKKKKVRQGKKKKKKHLVCFAV